MGSLILISLKRSPAQTPILGLLRMLKDVRMMSPMTTAQLGNQSAGVLENHSYFPIFFEFQTLSCTSKTFFI